MLPHAKEVVVEMGGWGVGGLDSEQVELELQLLAPTVTVIHGVR